MTMQMDSLAGMPQPQPQPADSDDVSIVEKGGAADVLLCTTDKRLQHHRRGRLLMRRLAFCRQAQPCPLAGGEGLLGHR